MKQVYLRHAVAWLLLPALSGAQVEVDRDRISVTTNNVIAIFRGGDLILMTNRLTGEVYCRTATSLPPLVDMGMIEPTRKPLRCTEWRRGRETPDGRIMSAQTTFTDLTRTIWMNVVIDQETQDIVITFWGESRRDGVTGVQWGIRSLDLSSGRLILPAQGGITADRESLPPRLTLSYPTEWEAQMLIWQASVGGFVMYSRDDEYRFKKLHLLRRGDYADVAVETEAVAPWASAGGAPQMEWRINAFRGDWRVPAAGYRKLMHFLHKPVETSGDRAWASAVRAVVTVQNPAPDNALLDTLASRLVPSKTLLYLPLWRKAGYDVNYPDYTPAEEVRAFVDHAHQLGFRVMLHTDLPGVSPGNPVFSRVKRYQVKDPRTGEPLGWYWDHPETDTQRFAFIDPAAKVYRDQFIESLRPVIEEIKPDALHLDVSGPAWNDGNGQIDGKNYMQGSVALHRALLSAFPGIVLGGESLNEVTAPYEWFAQRWIFGRLPPHPIAAFLFGDHVLSYGYLGEPNPDQSPSGFLRFFSRYERQGVAPTLVVSAPADLGVERAGMQRLLSLARAWQDHQIEPDWSGDWQAALFRFRGTPDVSGILETAGPGIALRLGNQTIYQRVRGVTRLVTAGFIPGWPAFDDTALYGLDPGREYWLDRAPRPSETLHLASLSDNAVLGEAQVTASFALFSLKPRERVAADLLRILPQAHTGITYDGKDQPLTDGGTAEANDTTCGGDQRPALFEHPPWQGKRTDGETYVEYSLFVPQAPHPALTFAFGLADGAEKSDGVTFRISVDGKELWSENTSERTWHSRRLDMTPFAGKAITLRFITNAGPKHDVSFDHAAWTDLRLLADTGSTSSAATVALPPGAQVASIAGVAKAPAASGGTISLQDLTLPARFVIFLTPGTVVSAGQSLLDVPHDASLESDGLMAPGSVYGSGAIGEASCGGARKARALNAHTPDHGSTIFSWVVQIPDSGTQRLDFCAGLADGAKTGGVGFDVRVDGESRWTWSTGTSAWKDGAVDLARWRGQTVLLQFVTDSAGDNLFDWAKWADITLRASP